MIVYHGSNSNFNTLKVSKSLTKWIEGNNIDGITTRYFPSGYQEDTGIYFSLDEEEAKRYGRYLYMIEIDDKCVKDFTNKVNCNAYLAAIAVDINQKLQISLFDYINMAQLSELMYYGKIRISGIGNEIGLMLESNERFNKIAESKRNRTYQLLRAWDKKEIQAILFNSPNKKEGIIKKVDKDHMRILGKKKL